MGSTWVGRYRTRSVRFLRLWPVDGWQVKVYGIAADAELPRPELVEAAKSVCRAALPQPALGEGRHGVAILTVHDGHSTWAIVDWWANGNLLYHHLFGGERDTPQVLRPVTGGLTACTWELAITAFERQAWLNDVFAAANPSMERYLDARLNAEV